MRQDYRIVLEISENGNWQQLGEKSIRTRSLNSAKAQATLFCYPFEEMRYFWGKLDTGWFKEVHQNGDGLRLVARKFTDCLHKCAYLRVEWMDPQLNLYDTDITNQRIHESWTSYRFRQQLERLLS